MCSRPENYSPLMISCYKGYYEIVVAGQKWIVDIPENWKCCHVITIGADLDPSRLEAGVSLFAHIGVSRYGHSFEPL